MRGAEDGSSQGLPPHLEATGPQDLALLDRGREAIATPGGDTGLPGATPVPRVARRRLPLGIHPAWVVIVGAGALLWRVAMGTGLNTDVFWQLASGQWMLAHHGVIRHDVFSYTLHGRTWVAEEWGFEVALAWLVRSIGPVSYWLLSAGACTAALAFGVARWRRLGAGWLWTAVLAVVAVGALAFGIAPRPQDLSYAFFALELLVLTLARRRRAWLFALPPLMLVWANVHGSFLLGLVLIGLEVVWSVLPASNRRVRVMQRLPTRAVLLTLLAATAAAFVNPRGPGLLAYAFHVSLAPQLTAQISEWQSPNFHSLLMLALIIGPAVALVGVLAFAEAPVAIEDLCLWALMFLATLHAVRFLPYLGIAWGGMAARWKPIRRETIRASLLTWPLAAVVALAMLAGPHPPAGAVERGSGPLGAPVTAGRFLTHQKGRVFSSYAWNDYLIHLGIPVFVDGRTDAYFGTGILSQYTQIADVQVNPDPLLSRWHVRWVLWQSGSPLAVYLAHDPAWRLAFHSGTSLVFERLSPRPAPGAAQAVPAPAT